MTAYLARAGALLSTSVLVVFATQAQSPPPTASATEAAPETLAERRIEGPWRLRALVEKGASAPDSGGQFQEFSQAVCLGPDNFLFWARFGPKNENRAIYSYKAGKTRAVIIPAGKGWDAMVNLNPGNGVAFLTRFKAKSAVDVWNGETLTRILGRGDAWEAAGTRFTLEEAVVMGSAEGLAILEYAAKTPRKIKGWALHDGHALTPLFAAGDPLPSQPGVVVQDLGLPVVAGGSVYALLAVEGAPYKGALFRIFPGPALKVTEVGGKDPFDATKTLRTINWIASLGADRLAIHATRYWGFGNVEDVVYAYEPGKLRLAFDKAASGVVKFKALRWKNPEGGWRDYSLGPGGFVAPGRPEYAFLATYSRPAGMHSGSQSITLKSDVQTRLMLHDGDKTEIVALLGITGPPGTFQARPMIGEVSGLVLRAGGLDVAFVEATESDVRVTDVPVFVVVGGRKVSLAQVVQWVGPGQAIVRLDDGIFSLEK